MILLKIQSLCKELGNPVLHRIRQEPQGCLTKPMSPVTPSTRQPNGYMKGYLELLWQQQIEFTHLPHHLHGLNNNVLAAFAKIDSKCSFNIR